MTTWLHFVGRRYYTLAAFVKEAKHCGVTRRVSIAQLKQMSYGDRIVLAIRDGKSALVFGCFYLETISGLSDAATAEIYRRFLARVISMGGFPVSCGCGSYFAGATMVVNASVADICAALTCMPDPGKPMVGGTFVGYGPVRLKDVPHQQGFRRFDWDAFGTAVATWKPDGRHKHPVVRGQFYAAPRAFASAPASDGRVQGVKEYTAN